MASQSRKTTQAHNGSQGPLGPYLAFHPSPIGIAPHSNTHLVTTGAHRSATRQLDYDPMLSLTPTFTSEVLLSVFEHNTYLQRLYLLSPSTMSDPFFLWI